MLAAMLYDRSLVWAHADTLLVVSAVFLVVQGLALLYNLEFLDDRDE